MQVNDIVLDHRTKGIPGLSGPFAAGHIATKGWNVLRGDMPLPLAVLKESVLANNAKWIADFASAAGVSLCPHGKTTMSPEIFRRQLAGGAWGITLSTPHQVQVARDFSVNRILLANQLVDPTFIDYISAELTRDPTFDFYCLVDSVAGVNLLRDRLAGSRPVRPVQLLIEVGMRGGRTGCRSIEQVLEVARAAKGSSPLLTVRGVEGFEGVVPHSAIEDPQPVRDFLDFMTRAARAIQNENLFSADEIVLSAGGSAYFDIVADHLTGLEFGRPYRVVLRSGCYVSHDSDMYVTYFDAIERRSSLARSVPGRLSAALELLAYVQSRPEADLVLLTAGKRDCSYDHHLPTPLATMRPGRDKALSQLGSGFVVTTLNDQHAFMRVPVESDIAVGDIVALGVSHPCTTFDKWDVVYGIDDEYNVMSAFKTYF